MSEEVYVVYGGGKRRRTRISIYYKSDLYTEQKPELHSFNMLFDFGVIAFNAEHVFNGWLNAYETMSPTMNFIFLQSQVVTSILKVSFWR